MPRDLQSDLELAERARHGEPAAWRAIYDQTCDSLFAFLCWQVGDREAARDLLQDTYLQAFRRLEQWRGEAPLEAWLRAIALGRSLDWKRVWLRRLKRATPLTDDASSVAADVDGVRFDSERAVLRAALAKLPARQRAALLLREWEGRSFDEIAALLGCAESTARVHHTRARERMRTELRGKTRPWTEREWEGQQT